MSSSISTQPAEGAPDALTYHDLQCSAKEIHEARKLRDVVRESPGLIKRTVNEIVERGEEPTKADLQICLPVPSRPHA